MAVVDELVTILGVELKSSVALNLGKFAKMLGTGMAEAAKLGAAIVGARAALEGYLQYAVHGATEMQKLSERTGLATEELQKWGFAAERAGGSAESLYGDIERLQQTFLGSGKSAEKQLLALADQFQDMSGASAQVHGRFWGLSDDTIQLLRKGRQGIKELRQEAEALGGVVPDELIKRGFEFRKALNEIRFALKGIGQQIALGTLPYLEKIVQQFRDWLKVNRDWIKENIGAVFEGLVRGFDRFLSGLEKVYKFIAPFVGKLAQFNLGMTRAEIVMRGVTALLAAMALALAPLAIKWALVAGAVTAAILVIEDVWTYFEGGDSILGRIIAKLDNFIDKLKELGRELKNSAIYQFFAKVADTVERFLVMLMKISEALLPKGDGAANVGTDYDMSGLSGTGGGALPASVPSTVSNATNNTTNNYNYPPLNLTESQKAIMRGAFAAAYIGNVSAVPVAR